MKSEENNYKLEAGVVSQLIAAHNMLYIFPDKIKSGEFVSQALKNIPAIEKCSICIRGIDKVIGDFSKEAKKILIEIKNTSKDQDYFSITFSANGNAMTLALQTSLRTYGYMIIKVKKDSLSENLRAAVSNFINIFSVDLERRWQKEELETYRDHLEKQVEIRTADLQIEISERKKAEETLKESEEKFRLIYETSGDGVMTLEPPEWRFTSGNNKILEIFRVKDENEFLSLAPWDFSPEYQPDGKLSNVKAKEMIDIAMSEGENFFEWTHKRIRGEEFYATVLLNKVEFKDKVFLQARVNDITYRKKAEEALRESEEKLRTTIENINDIIIWRMDEKGIFTYLSPAVLNILGYEPDEMEETSGFSYFKPEDKLLLQEKMAARITGDRTPNEFEMVAKDGSLIPMEIISSAIKNENGDTVGFSGIARDISERKKAEEEILKLKDGLEVQVAEKTKELKEKVSDLQRFFDATVDRELRMKELSDENEKLKAELEKKT